MRFEWDPAKDKINRAKHGLSFDEVTELFEEDRFIAVGPIRRGVIVVAYTARDDDVLRILSARMTTKREHQRYKESKGEKHERRDS